MTAAPSPPLLSVEERALGESLLSNPRLLEQIREDLTSLGIAGEDTLKTLVYLAGTSRLLAKPLALIVRAASSSGKSFVLDTVARLFPEEAKLIAHDLTPQALFYLPPDSLRHRWVIAGERRLRQDDDAADATKAIRELLASGELRKRTVAKVGGRLQTLEVYQRGPIAFAETTTAGAIFEEDANRCLIVTTDETDEQTVRITKAQARRWTGHGPDEEAIGRVVATHHAAQRLLAEEEANVVVPFAERIQLSLATDRLATRRAFPLLLATIAATALLHARQRERDADGRIIATVADYRASLELAGDALGDSIGGRPGAAVRRFWTAARSTAQLSEGDVFNAPALARTLGMEKRRVAEKLTELAAFGVVAVVDPGRGPLPASWKVEADTLPDGHSLPAPETLGC